MLVEDEKLMVSGHWGPSCALSQCREKPGHGWKWGLKLDIQPTGAQEGFKARVPQPWAGCAPAWGILQAKGRGFHWCFSMLENPCFPLCSSVAKATVFTGITCFRVLLGPQTSFTQGFTHRVLCSIFCSSKWQNLYATHLKN